MTARDLAVIVVAAGRGERLKADTPKALVAVNGQTILERALRPLTQLAQLSQVVITAPANRINEVTEIANRVVSDAVSLQVVAGGETRQQSIANALAEVSTEFVLIHDAARAFATAELFDRVYEKVKSSGHGVIPALEISDTIKKVSAGQVLETVDRSLLRSAQTPQGFVTSDIKAAYDAATEDHTDDAALFQSLGKEIHYVAGEKLAAKITTPEDLAEVNARLNGPGRIGIGTDTHRFSADPTKKLFLGTIEWPGVPGLDGHSDGDAVSHAIVDALLSAAGLGDIGGNFGVDRPEFAGANGSIFLAETLKLLAQHGFAVVNVSVQLIGNRPKVSTKRADAEAALSKLVGAPVSLTATTTDGLGFLGNDEGVAAVASALIIGAKDRLNS